MENFHTSILPKPIKWHHTFTLRSSDEAIQYLKNTPAIWNLRKRKKPYQRCVNNTALPFKSENNVWSHTGRHPRRCQNMFSAMFQSAFCHFSHGNRDAAKFRKMSNYFELVGLHSINKIQRSMWTITSLQNNHQGSTIDQQYAPKWNIFTSNSCSSTELSEFRKLICVFFLNSLRMLTIG